MKQSVHLFDPVCGNKLGSMFVTMRCGMVRKPADIISTTNTAEVTCIKCRSYINNPYRVMRKYGRVKVVESFFVMLWADYGYKLDMVAVAESPGNWNLIITSKNQPHMVRALSAGNMADLGFKLLAIYEKEITQPVVADTQPAASINNQIVNQKS